MTAFKFLLLILTVNCPLRCKMCFNWQNRETGEIETGILKTLIAEMHAGGLFADGASVNFAGGEALLRQDVFELIAFAAERKLATSLSTSGHIYNEVVARKIKESGLGCIALPLDSLDPAKHNYLRGTAGVFENTMRIINEHPGKVFLTCTISAYNFDEIGRIAEWAEQNNNVAGIGYQAIVRPFNSTVSQEDFYMRRRFSHLWPKDTGRVIENLERLIRLREGSSKINTTAKHLAFFAEYFRDPQKVNREVACRVGDYSVAVMNKGDVVFCHSMEPIGNARRSGICEILSSPQAARARARMLECRQTCEFFINCFFED